MLPRAATLTYPDLRKAAKALFRGPQRTGRNSLVRTAMKRQFCKWKDVGAVVPIRTSSRIWSSLKVAAGS